MRKYLQLLILAIMVLTTVVGGSIIISSEEYGLGLFGETDITMSEISDPNMMAHHNFWIGYNNSTGQTRVTVRTEEDVGSFEGQFSIPLDGNMENVESTHGEVNYDRDNDIYKLDIELNEPKSSFSFVYNYNLDTIDEQYGDEIEVHSIETRFDGSQEIRVQSERPINSIVPEQQLDYNITDNISNIQSDETASMRVIIGEPDYNIDGLAIYDESDIIGKDVKIEDMESMYHTTSSTVGFEATDINHPILLQDDDEFNIEVDIDAEVGGIYNKGVSRIPKSTFDNNQGLSVTSHELVHSKNDQIGDIPRWFDEGVAMYVQSIVANQNDELYIPPFVQEYEYPNNCRNENTDDCRIYSSPNSVDQLREYLEDPQFEYYNWQSNISFKYETSDLYTRYFVSNNINGDTFENLYQELLEKNINLRNEGDVNSAIFNLIGDDTVLPCQSFENTNDDLNDCIEEYS